jgi:DNA polymerase-4
MKESGSIHPSLLRRKIIHCDMDAFYASVEIRDNPRLADKPLVIGGSPHSRSVVCTASYAARKFGIRSAMPCSQAYKLCPSAIFMPPNFEKYHEASHQIHAIFQRYTDLIEPLSLDEAYLDVTKNERGLFACKIAVEMQNSIRRELQLSCSLGIAPNKVVAKIASDFKKPAGITVVQPHEVEAFMRPLAVRKIPFVGPVTEKKLHALGIFYCHELASCSEELLLDNFGSHALGLKYRASGIDEEPVIKERIRKSIGVESTFQTDLIERDDLIRELRALTHELAERIIEHGSFGTTITLKVKYADFTTITRSRSLSYEISDTNLIFETAQHLLFTKTSAGTVKIRLLGISISGFKSNLAFSQNTLLESFNDS